MHAQLRVQGDHGGADVQAGAVLMGHPVLIDFHQLLQALEGGFFIQMGHGHALGAAGHAGQVFLRAEQLQPAVLPAVALGALKNGLPVVEHHRRRIHGKIAVGHNARVVPAAALFVVHQEHMIGEDAAKAQLGFVLGLLLEDRGQGNLDFLHTDCLRFLPCRAFGRKHAFSRVFFYYSGGLCDVKPCPMPLPWVNVVFALYFPRG